MTSEQIFKWLIETVLIFGFLAFLRRLVSLTSDCAHKGYALRVEWVSLAVYFVTSVAFGVSAVGFYQIYLQML